MKKIVYIDMDGVTCNFNKAMKEYDPTLDLHHPENWDLVGKIAAEHKRLFFILEPIDGAIEAINRLLDNPKFDVYFLSTPMWEQPESYTGKRYWLGKHFGDKVTNRLILSKRKDLNIGDYLIDDTFRNGAGDFTGEHIHFGGDEYPTWKEVITYLESK